MTGALGLAHGRGLGVREHHARHGVVVGGPRPAEDVGRRHAALVLAHVGERPDAGGVADRPHAVGHVHAVVHRYPLLRGLHAHRLEPEPLGARPPAGGHEQAIAAQLVALRELDHELVPVTPDGRRVLAEAQLDPLRGQGLAQTLPQRLGLARQQVVRPLHERDRRAQARHGLSHLHAHGPAAEHEQPLRHLCEGGDLAVGPDAVELVEARHRRHHRIRSGGDHHVVRGEHLLADLDAAGAREPGRPAQDLDALSGEVLDLVGVVEPRGHEVAPRERRLRVHPAAHGLGRARRFARGLERLAGAQKRL